MERALLLIVVLLMTGFSHGDVAGKFHRQDPVAVNGDTIRLRLENPRLRVLEAAIKPGDKEKMHSHPDYVVYVIEGGKFRNHAVDGTVSEGEFKTGDVVYRDALTHWAENIGDTTIRLVLVELKY